MKNRFIYPSTQRNGEATVAVQDRQIPNPYQWLENSTDPAVQEWLTQQHTLRSEFIGRDEGEWLAIRDYVSGLPLYEADHFALTIAGDQCIYAMQPPGADQVNIYAVPLRGGEPRLLIDPQSDFSESGWRIYEGCLEASPCGRYVVFSVNRHGRDVTDFRVYDLQQARILNDRISELICEPISWKLDSSGFYYGAFRSLMGESNTADGLYFHPLGGDEAQDTCLYELDKEQQADFLALIPWVIPDSEQMLVMRYSYRHLAAGLWLMALDGSEPVRVLFEDYEAEFSVVGVRDGQVFLRTTFGAENGRILSIPLANPARENWREVVSPGSRPIARAFPGFEDNRCCICGDRLLVTYMDDAKHRIAVMDLNGRELAQVPSQCPSTVIGLLPFSDTQYILSVSSFLQPLSLYSSNLSFNLNPNDSSVGEKPVPFVEFNLANSELDEVEVRQVFYSADDGQRIPLYLIGKDLDKRSERRPVLLYGYGGFNQSITPVFNPDLPVWLKMGGVYALANIRGGGEYGKTWHEAAKGAKRHVSFSDFRAAADFLVAEGLTDREHLGIRGISNGGLLMGASVVLYPESWAAVIAEAPLLDMVHMLQHPGADVLCKEYGAISHDPEVQEVVLGYSPVQNVRSGVDYPAVMAVPGGEDPRAHPCESWKFIAELQHHNPNGRPALINTVQGEGHVSWSTTSIAATMADEMMFLRNTVKDLKEFRSISC